MSNMYDHLRGVQIFKKSGEEKFVVMQVITFPCEKRLCIHFFFIRKVYIYSLWIHMLYGYICPDTNNTHYDHFVITFIKYGTISNIAIIFSIFMCPRYKRAHHKRCM
jgi:hypothetical protein